MKNAVIIILCIFIFFGCKKDKPPTGKYLATFNSENPQVSVRSCYFEITESSKNSIIINDSELQKDGKKIKGSFWVSCYNGIFYIDGSWSKKIFNNSYSIKGSFTYTYYINGNGTKYEEFGTFTIKSDF